MNLQHALTAVHAAEGEPTGFAPFKTANAAPGDKLRPRVCAQGLLPA